MRNLPPVQRGFLATVALLGGGATKWVLLPSSLPVTARQLTSSLPALTSAELAYEKFIRDEWQGPSADRLHEQEAHARDEWQTMSPKERALRWTIDHKYQVVFGS